MSVSASRTRARAALQPLALVSLLISLIACEDPARPVPPSQGGSVHVASDPPGAEVMIDAVALADSTPVTVDDVSPGVHHLRVVLDSSNYRYDFTATFSSQRGEHVRFDVPLTLRCYDPLCARDAAFFQSPGNIRFALSGAGPPFTTGQGMGGLVWPAASANSYVASAAPVVAARIDGEDFALGLGNYAAGINYWAGRPAPETGMVGGDFVVTQESWLVPYGESAPGLRGIAVQQYTIVPAAFPDVILLQLVFHNISDRADYRTLDIGVPEGGVQFEDVYVGLAMAPDVGGLYSREDLVAYDPARDLVFAYEPDFRVSDFGVEPWQPGIIGLAPLVDSGLEVRLNAWTGPHEWQAGERENEGYEILTATQADPADHPLPNVGFAPDSLTGEYRISVTVGPFRLAPGERVGTTIVVLMAEPVAGTFTSGELVPAGDPADPSRAIMATAAELAERLDAVRAAYD